MALRQRSKPRAPTVKDADGSNDDERNEAGLVTPSQSTPIGTSRGRSYAFVGAVLITFVLLFILGRKNAARRIPDSYALCSEGNDIYTVDEKNPQVQCLVVHGSRILDTGSIGTGSIVLVSHEILISVISIRGSAPAMGRPGKDRACPWFFAKRKKWTEILLCKTWTHSCPRSRWWGYTRPQNQWNPN